MTKVSVLTCYNVARLNDIKNYKLCMKFITGNSRKYEEVRDLLAPILVEQISMRLDEIQELDPRKIIEHKLSQARAAGFGECIVEDSALYLDALNGFPGPLVKWLEDAVGLVKISELTEALGNSKARVETIVGYFDGISRCEYFTGSLNGEIVKPRGEKDFGYGTIFVPEGHCKTFGEMERSEKHSLSMRAQAVQKFKQYLQNQK